MNRRVVIFDVDDVFVDMDRLADASVDAIGSSLVARLGETQGRVVTERFRECYATLRTQLRAGTDQQSRAFLELRDRIVAWQRGVLDAGHPLKIWSRETMLAAALERENVPVSGALVHEVVDAYWSVLAERSEVFADAARAVQRCRAAGIYVHLATNSDGNLLFDEAQQTFRYDPAHAWRTKQSRLSVLGGVGVEDGDLTIGDPIGKPDPAFFRGVLANVAKRLDGPVDLAQISAVGDSFTDDIRPLLDLGVVRGSWLLRRGDAPSPDPRVDVIHSLDELEID